MRVTRLVRFQHILANFNVIYSACRESVVIREFKSCHADRFQNAVVVELVIHTGLKILHEDTLWVRIPPAVPNFKAKEYIR